jgi:hypothetical protein
MYMAPSGFGEEGLSRWLNGSVKAWRLVPTPYLHHGRQAVEQRISAIRNKVMED